MARVRWKELLDSLPGHGHHEGEVVPANAVGPIPADKVLRGKAIMSSFISAAAVRLLSVAAFLGLGLPALAADAPKADPFRPFLVQHCLECHGAVKPKGELRLDQLAADFANDASRERWLAVLKRVEAGEMPPKAKPKPPAKEMQALTAWIRTQAAAAEAARRADGRVVLRRLNRVEYENTVRDLLGVDIELKDLLPADSASNGFDNVGEALHLSSFLMERYLEAADKALNVAIANLPQPPVIKKRFSLKESHVVKTTTESVYRFHDDTVVCFCSSAWHSVWLSPFYPPDRGRYRFRISASGYQSAGKPVTYRVTAGGGRLAGKSGLVGYFDAPADKPTVIEFEQYLEPRTTVAILPYGLAGANTVKMTGADKYEGPGLAVQFVEVEGPLHDTWPPAGHRRIFGELAQAPAPIYNYRNRVEVASQNPDADAERILLTFARRAFRRAVTADDVRPFVELVKARLAEKYSFEQAVRVGLKGILVSPDFLFLREKPGKLDDFALASRLSYFLWSTMPDEELLALAEQGKLSQPETIRRQVERLLQHPKAAAFTEHFVGQWLGLREIDATEPSHLLYSEFDHMLKVSMIRESELFFDEVLKDDLSLTNFVASDFTMLNGRLAKHYGIPGVDGWEFRKVALPKDSHRGGVLTMASVLKVTANGTSTSPVLRGAWVLDRILGTPPTPPPEGVPGLEPDTRGATTIREQLAKHRSVGACASCHTKIDPPGFALESFDVIGGWRDNYRTTGSGKSVVVDGRRMSYHEGKKVDPSDVLPDGRKFANIDEFKQLLLADRDQLARALTVKLLTYATGGAPTTADHAEIEAMVGKIQDRNYGLRTLVHEIVQSKAFQNK
jgi:mono/diheme cytochrome c family protein